MKKINYKKEYLREFNLRCDYSEKMDSYRRKMLFWQLLGILFIIITIVFVAISLEAPGLAAKITTALSNLFGSIKGR